MISFRMERLRQSDPTLFRDARGLLVTRVKPDTEASNIGLSPGDILLEFDGAKLSRYYDLEQAIARAQDKAKVPLYLLRNGKSISLEMSASPLDVELELQ